MKAFDDWTNYQTWAVNIWMERNDKARRYWREKAVKHRRAARECLLVHERIWTEQDAVKSSFAEQIKEEIYGGVPFSGDSGLYGDLLWAAIGQVNWIELAEHWLNAN